MSKEVCMSCSACGGKCDQCDLDCCIKNMANHDEMFYLASQFQNKVYSAQGQLLDKANEIKNDLLKKQISLNGYTCCLSHCEGLLKEMQNKYDDFSINNKELVFKINEGKKSAEQEEKKIIDSCNQKIYCLKQFYEKERSWLDTEIEKEKFKRKEIDTLKESINDLTKKRENIINMNMNEIANDYINEEQPKIEIKRKEEKEKNTDHAIFTGYAPTMTRTTANNNMIKIQNIRHIEESKKPKLIKK